MVVWLPMVVVGGCRSGDAGNCGMLLVVMQCWYEPLTYAETQAFPGRCGQQWRSAEGIKDHFLFFYLLYLFIYSFIFLFFSDWSFQLLSS